MSPIWKLRLKLQSLARSLSIIGSGSGRENMILVALGSNLVSDTFKSSEELLDASLKTLKKHGIFVNARSSWYRSAPVPVSDQPWFVNGVAEVDSPLDPAALLQILHRVEGEYGRIRRERNDSRTLDLDLLAHGDQVIDRPGSLILPHPRLQERAFVLLPLAELAPGWRHPVSGLTAGEMLESLPPGQKVERIG